MNHQLFNVSNSCMEHGQLLHYTSFDTLEIILKKKTLKCNSLRNVNDLLEKNRKGIEDFTESFFVSCFCHYQYEIVPFWFMYGGNAPKEKKVLLRINNFSNRLDQIINTDHATTSEKKIIYFDQKRLFHNNSDTISCNPINSPFVENRTTINKIKLFDVNYLPPNDEVFSKEYQTDGQVRFGETQDVFGASIYDLRSVGKDKTIHWEHEKETRIMCQLSNYISDFDSIFLCINDGFFKDMTIVANPWATDDFVSEIEKIVEKSVISEPIKNTIKVTKSELHGQICSD